jgi:ABC-type glutathione transport system ATPase component
VLACPDDRFSHPHRQLQEQASELQGPAIPGGAVKPLPISTPLLEVRGVTLQYKTKDHLVTATYRVSFDVMQSERFVLLGPSGCGVDR